MLSIRKDATANGAGAFVVEMTKKSYKPAEGFERGRVIDDEGAVDVMRCRADERELLAIAREIIRHLPQDRLNELVEGRLNKIWETEGLSIPYGATVQIGGMGRHILIPSKA